MWKGLVTTSFHPPVNQEQRLSPASVGPGLGQVSIWHPFESSGYKRRTKGEHWAPSNQTEPEFTRIL